MYCIVMAGGSGTRFWPWSREDRSKQFIKILGKDTLIQSTLKRFEKIVGWNHIFIVAKARQEPILTKHAGKIPKSNFIFEPIGKNTAPCIGLAALHLSRINPEAVMVVSPADHLVKKEGQFRKTIEAAAQIAKENAMVTIGIPPTRPSTGYGYIQIGNEKRTLHKVDTFRIKTFAEKPNIETARKFVESGDFFWNSGIFIFKVNVLLQAIEDLIPELYQSLMEIKKAFNGGQYETVLNRVYHQIKSVSIDYGIMESAANIYMVKGDFLWNDLGSWDQVYKLTPHDSKGNAMIGHAVLIDTENSYVASDTGVIAVMGMDDVVVVREGNAVLVCKRNQSENVKLIVERLKREKLEAYL